MIFRVRKIRRPAMSISPLMRDCPTCGAFPKHACVVFRTDGATSPTSPHHSRRTA